MKAKIVKKNPTPVKKQVVKVSDLKQYSKNPRKITEEDKAILKQGLEEYGDLGGIVYNVQLECLVGGNQRSVTLDPSDKIVITERFKKPTKTGTVAEGYILNNGEKFSYREVAWNEQRHKAATLIANKAGGTWDFGMLTETLRELNEQKFNMNMTGFNKVELDNYIMPVDFSDLPSSTGEMVVNVEGATKIEHRKIGEEQIKENFEKAERFHIEIWLKSAEFMEFNEKAGELLKTHNLESYSDLVLKLIREEYDKQK